MDTQQPSASELFDLGDLFAWEALFAVLADPRGRLVLHGLLPTTPTDARVIAVVEGLDADWSTFPAGNLSETDVEGAVTRLRAQLSVEEFRQLQFAGRILQPDISGGGSTAWAWPLVLRKWQSSPGAPSEALPILRRCATLLEFDRDHSLIVDPPQWQSYIEFAQGHLVGAEVRTFLVALPDDERDIVLEAARQVIRPYGMPLSMIAVPTFVQGDVVH
jgi:hypothetical protein